MPTDNMTASSGTQVFQVQSDSLGNWSLQIDSGIAPGPHMVTVQDEQGGETQFMLYVLGNDQTSTQSLLQPAPAADIIPPFLLYSLAIMTVMIIILIINALRLAKRSDPNKSKNNRLNYLLLIIIAIILIGTLAVSLSFQVRRLQNENNQKIQQQLMKVSGRLIDPLTLNGVTDVDLVSGNTTIRTNDGGGFLFSNVTAEGIRATHANLLRTVVLLPNNTPAKQDETIYFNVGLYNTLIKIIDWEMRGQNFKVYDLLAPQLKKKTTADKYQTATRSIYKPTNIDDQQINLLETSLLDDYNAEAYELRFSKVLRLKVAANGTTADYYFVSDGQGGWQLIK